MFNHTKVENSYFLVGLNNRESVISLKELVKTKKDLVLSPRYVHLVIRWHVQGELDPADVVTTVVKI